MTDITAFKHQRSKMHQNNVHKRAYQQKVDISLDTRM